MSDPCSFTNSDKFRSESIHFDWLINFESQCIEGTAALKCSVSNPTNHFILDTRFLDVKSVEVANQKAAFELGEFHPAKGQALTITAPSEVPAGEVSIKIAYATTSKCTALQWLRPAQTCGGEHPYLFSQCQAIHARSLFPCQDSPGIKIKYTAAVTVKDPLVALMSANLQHDKTESGLFLLLIGQNSHPLFSQWKQDLSFYSTCANEYIFGSNRLRRFDVT